MSESQLIRYDAACRAVAEAKQFDEVRDIMNKADAVREYARRAKNKELETDAAEIRMRAHRRWGELAAEMKASGQLAVGRKKIVLPEGQFSDDEPERVTLDEMGVSRNFSSQGQKLAAVPEQKFEGIVGEWRERILKDGERVTTSLLKQEVREQERQAFSERTIDGCSVDDLHELTARGAKFGAILADPPWAFKTRSALGADRAASRHYQTDEAGDMAKLPVADLAADDCLLLLWTSGPHLVDALCLIEAWGFSYKTIGFDWMKLNPSGEGLFMGPGYWTRANSEPCLLATKGSPRRLNADVRSAILSPVMEHSRKPDDAHAGIERLVRGPYLELYGRRQRTNWTVWGNEIAKSDLVRPDASAASEETVDGDPAWWEEARQMRAVGARILDIATALKRSPSTVHNALDEDGGRSANKRRAKRLRRQHAFRSGGDVAIVRPIP